MTVVGHVWTIMHDAKSTAMNTVMIIMISTYRTVMAVTRTVMSTFTITVIVSDQYDEDRCVDGDECGV